MNCPNLGKIIERRWSDNFTRLSEVLHEVVQMWEHTFLKDADYRDISGNKFSLHSIIFPTGVVHRVENGWCLTKVAVVLLNGLIW